jgi:hypothetical protein
MIAASGRFDLAFTCVDSTGAPVAPTGTPTGTLVKNGTDLGTTVTVTMSTAQGVASCTIPGDAVNGDRFYIRVSAVVSAVTYVLSGPVETIQNTVTLPTAPTDWITADALKADAVTEIQSGLASQTSVNNLLVTALTESYASVGTVPTLTQALLMILAHMERRSISGTTETVKKVDGTTTAATYTLDSATAPTSITRAT